MKLPFDDWHWTLLMVSQHWFRRWFGSVRQQAITRVSVDTDVCRHIASLGHNELSISHNANGDLTKLACFLDKTANSYHAWFKFHAILRNPVISKPIGWLRDIETLSALPTHLYGSVTPYGVMDLVNSLRPSGVCMRRWTGSALVQVMACRLFGDKLLSGPMLEYGYFEPQEEFSVKS